MALWNILIVAFSLRYLSPCSSPWISYLSSVVVCSVVRFDEYTFMGDSHVGGICTAFGTNVCCSYAWCSSVIMSLCQFGAGLVQLLGAHYVDS
jgi:hypothetical protein